MLQIVVVANPANTNALILAENAPSIPRENITALTRLDHNRVLGQVRLWDMQVGVNGLHQVGLICFTLQGIRIACVECHSLCKHLNLCRRLHHPPAAQGTSFLLKTQIRF